MKLANIALDEEFVNTDLVGHFHYCREEYGLAKLLTLVKEYVQTKTIDQAQAYSTTSETTTPNQTPM